MEVRRCKSSMKIFTSYKVIRRPFPLNKVKRSSTQQKSALQRVLIIYREPGFLAVV
jgi:hypothetical protein